MIRMGTSEGVAASSRVTTRTTGSASSEKACPMTAPPGGDPLEQAAVRPSHRAEPRQERALIRRISDPGVRNAKARTPSRIAGRGVLVVALHSVTGSATMRCLTTLVAFATLACARAGSTPASPPPTPAPAAVQQPPRQEPTRPAGQGPGGGAQQQEGPRPYGQVITAQAVTDSGVFIVHRIGEKATR